MNKIDTSKWTAKDTIEIFTKSILETSISQLKAYQNREIVDEETEEKIGNFKLLYLFDKNDDYVLFIVKRIEINENEISIQISLDFNKPFLDIRRINGKYSEINNKLISSDIIKITRKLNEVLQ